MNEERSEQWRKLAEALQGHVEPYPAEATAKEWPEGCEAFAKALDAESFPNGWEFAFGGWRFSVKPK
jgi:hypothetical protein